MSDVDNETAGGSMETPTVVEGSKVPRGKRTPKEPQNQNLTAIAEEFKAGI